MGRRGSRRGGFPPRRPASPDTGLRAQSPQAGLHWSASCGSRHLCSLRGRWLQESSMPSIHRPPARASGALCAVACLCVPAAFAQTPAAPLPSVIVTARPHAAGTLRGAGRRRRDRPGRDRPRRGDAADRAAAPAGRRRDRRQRWPRPVLQRVHPRQQCQPCRGPGRRRAAERGHRRHHRLREPAAGAGRAHRGAARPGLQPVTARTRSAA